MPLSAYAQTALGTPATPTSGVTPTPGAAAPLSSYARAALPSTPDAQNYQSAFAAPASAPTPNLIASDLSGVRGAVLGQNITPTPRVPVTPKSYLTDIYGTPTNTGGNIGTQGGIFGDTLNAWIKVITDAGAAPMNTVGQRATAVTQAGLDAIGAFFQPVATVMNEAATVPGMVGDVAGYINNIFSKVGNVGGDTLAAYVQAGPFTESQKATLAPLAQQLGTLGAQIVLGKAGSDTFSALKDTTHSFLSTLAEDSRIKELNTNPTVRAAISKQTSGPAEPTNIPVQSSTEETQIPTIQADAPQSVAPETAPTAMEVPKTGEVAPSVNEAPKSTISPDLSPLAKEAQKYSSAEEFKNAMLQHATDVPEKVRASGVEKGQLASNVLEDIKSENPSYFLKNKDGSVQVGKNSQPIKSVFLVPKDALSKTETVGGVTRATGELGVKPIAEVPPNFNLTDFYNKVKGESNPVETPTNTEGTDGTRVTKAASDINQHLVNEGLSELTPEQQAKYTSGSYKDSKGQADIMADTDRASLNKMATTGKDIPAGVHPQILFNTIRDLAKGEKDYPLLQQLADSPLATERSEAAGTMGSAGYGQEKGANAEIDALQRAKEAKSGGPAGKAKTDAAVKEAKTTITKTAAKMMDFNKIIDAINTC